MSPKDFIGPKIPLAKDGLCANEWCPIRDTDKCPVYKIIHRITAPRVKDVIDTPTNSK